MTDQEAIQAQDAARAVERHYSEHGTSPQWIHDQLVRAGDAQAIAEVNTIDAILMRAPQPNARKLGRNRGIRNSAAFKRLREALQGPSVRVLTVSLCVMGLMAVAVLS